MEKEVKKLEVIGIGECKNGQYKEYYIRDPETKEGKYIWVYWNNLFRNNYRLSTCIVSSHTNPEGTLYSTMADGPCDEKGRYSEYDVTEGELGREQREYPHTKIYIKWNDIEKMPSQMPTYHEYSSASTAEFIFGLWVVFALLILLYCSIKNPELINYQKNDVNNAYTKLVSIFSNSTNCGKTPCCNFIDKSESIVEALKVYKGNQTYNMRRLVLGPKYRKY